MLKNALTLCKNADFSAKRRFYVFLPFFRGFSFFTMLLILLFPILFNVFFTFSNIWSSQSDSVPGAMLYRLFPAFYKFFYTFVH